MENGQARVSPLEHLDYCCILVSEMYGKPDIGAWTNGDFIRLGYILYKKTNVQISPNTLKRIFGKIKTDVRYYPQKATRDALARYLGYSNWEMFTVVAVPLLPVSEKSPAPLPPAGNILTGEPKVINVNAKSKAGLSYFGRGIMVVLFVAACILIYSILFPESVPNARLICQNPVGENPHSAAFVIQGMPSVTGPDNHYTIEFGDGKKISLTGGDSLYSHYYEVPGRYSAVLMKNGIPLDTASVYLKTNGWSATAKMMYDTNRVYPIEIRDLLTSGKKSVSVQEVYEAGVDTNRTFFVEFVNTQVTGISGDNFDLFIKLNTSASRPGIRCSQVRVTVFGETSRHFVDAMKPGCTHWTDLQFSEITKRGELNQLNFLGVDLHQGGTLEIKVDRQHARYYINSKLVFETDYKKPLKQIYGLGITFSGIGAIHSLTLKDRKTGKLFEGNFQ
jgi:hypothetical protein